MTQPTQPLMALVRAITQLTQPPMAVVGPTQLTQTQMVLDWVDITNPTTDGFGSGQHNQPNHRRFWIVQT